MPLLPDSDEFKFYQLFWATRREHGKNSEGAKHAAYLKYCGSKKDWAWAGILLKASRKIYTRSKHIDEALDLLDQIQPPSFAEGLIDHLKGWCYSEKKDLDKSIAAYKKALASPNYDISGYTWNNLGIALAEKKDFDAAIEAYRKALADPNYDTIGYTWNNLGLAQAGKKDFDAAIEAYRKALADPNYDTIGYAWNNLGLALAEKKDFDAAIEAYRTSLADPTYDTPGNAWNNLGIALAEKKDFDAAIEAYRKVLADPTYDTPGNAWNNLGVAYEEKNDFNKALNAYRKALDQPEFEHKATTWQNLASLYKKQGKKVLAIEACSKMIEIKDVDPLAKNWAELQLSLLKQEIPEEALSPDDRALLQDKEKSQPVTTDGPNKEKDTPETRILARRGDKTKYREYTEKFKKDSAKDNCLSILRGWSSSVTLLEGGKGRWRGGGYFLKWHGFGIVLDPGFDFLHNFHDAGFHALEIKAVLVSHNHPDHNDNVKQIDDLIYEVYRNSKHTYVFLPDADTEEAIMFTFPDAAHRATKKLDYVDYGETEEEGKSNRYGLKKTYKLPLKVTTFMAQHDAALKHALGLVLELCDENQKSILRIGYTGDTGYYDGLAQKLGDCDILIAHISEPTEDELKDENCPPKPTHLGYRGMIRLLNEIKNKPSLILIGEFWAGLQDTRIEIIQGLRLRTGLKNIYPAGLGMEIKLEKPFPIICSNCSKPSETTNIAPAKDSYGDLAYLCPSCMISVL